MTKFEMGKNNQSEFRFKRTEMKIVLERGLIMTFEGLKMQLSFCFYKHVSCGKIFFFLVLSLRLLLEVAM